MIQIILLDGALPSAGRRYWNLMDVPTCETIYFYFLVVCFGDEYTGQLISGILFSHMSPLTWIRANKYWAGQNLRLSSRPSLGMSSPSVCSRKSNSKKRNCDRWTFVRSSCHSRSFFCCKMFVVGLILGAAVGRKCRECRQEDIETNLTKSSRFCRQPFRIIIRALNCCGLCTSHPSSFALHSDFDFFRPNLRWWSFRAQSNREGERKCEKKRNGSTTRCQCFSSSSWVFFSAIKFWMVALVLSSVPYLLLLSTVISSFDFSTHR